MSCKEESSNSNLIGVQKLLPTSYRVGHTSLHRLQNLRFSKERHFYYMNAKIMGFDAFKATLLFILEFCNSNWYERETMPLNVTTFYCSKRHVKNAL